MISVIIPVYNEEKLIGKTLAALVDNAGIEVIAVDGGSSDHSIDLLKRYPVTLLRHQKNRARQLNAGARAAGGDILLFLHADCFVHPQAFAAIKQCIDSGFGGGCLRHKIDSPGILYRLIERSGDARARLFKVFYGDQAIFVRKEVFFALGGFDDVPLFDDIFFSKKLKKHTATCVLTEPVYASSRRWQKQGIMKATAVNWLLVAGLSLGFSPRTLKRLYQDIR